MRPGAGEYADALEGIEENEDGCEDTNELEDLRRWRCETGDDGLDSPEDNEDDDDDDDEGDETLQDGHMLISRYCVAAAELVEIALGVRFLELVSIGKGLGPEVRAVGEGI